jgi:hypothetical protein
MSKEKSFLKRQKNEQTEIKLQTQENALQRFTDKKQVKFLLFL